MLLSDLFPPDTILAAQSLGRSKTLPGRSPQFSGSFLSVSGSLPTLCHVGAVSPRSRALYEGAGFELPRTLVTYESDDDYLAAVRRLLEGGGRVVTVQPFGPDILPEEAWLVPPALAARLNDKGMLPSLVPPGQAPPRREVPATELAAWLGAARNRPALVKLPGPKPSGAGSSVRIVQRKRHLPRALELAAEQDVVVVEDFLPARRNYCILAVALADGSVRLLGGSDQLATRRGVHYGNWLDARRPVSRAAEELAVAVVERGAAEGFRGIAGIDVLELSDGRCVAIDLNFRFAGSTAFVMLADRLRAESGARYMRYALGGTFGTKAQIAASIERLAAFQREGWVRVLNFFDDVPSNPEPGGCLLECVLLADGPRGARRRMDRLREAGFRIKGENPGLVRRLATGAQRRLTGQRKMRPVSLE